MAGVILRRKTEPAIIGFHSPMSFGVTLVKDLGCVLGTAESHLTVLIVANPVQYFIPNIPQVSQRKIIMGLFRETSPLKELIVQEFPIWQFQHKCISRDELKPDPSRWNDLKHVKNSSLQNETPPLQNACQPKNPSSLFLGNNISGPGGLLIANCHRST